MKGKQNLVTAQTSLTSFFQSAQIRLETKFLLIITMQFFLHEQKERSDHQEHEAQ